jgi:anti-sigma factor RsiW
MTSALCSKIQSAFPAYLDGNLSGSEMQEIARHIDGSSASPGCEECAFEFAACKQVQNSIALLGPVKPPADLNLRLRLAISREQVRRHASWIDPISLAWDNTVRPMLLRVSAGFAGTVVLAGGIFLLLGMVAPPPAVLANDEPLGAVTAPHYLYSVLAPDAIVTRNDSAIIVEASVDNQGRVYDYTIVSGPQDDGVRAQVVNQLLLSVFKPASVFGLPVRGRVVITYAGISVRG